MKFISGALLAFVLTLSGNCAFAQISDLNSAINKAGRQRMLSQRMAKAYFQLGQQVDVERSRKVLEASVSLFDRQLVELKNYPSNQEVKETYLKLEKSWLAYKDLLIGTTPSPEHGRKVLVLSEEVLNLAQQGSSQLEKMSSTNAGHLVNLSGRERMLSQRMAKYYQAIAWGVADDKSASALEKARKEFSDALLELMSASANTQKIKDGLELTKQQWQFFDGALGQKAGADKRPQTTVATTSERILDEMEGVVALYEKLPK